MNALDETGITWVWGSNKKGELGLGDCTPRQLPFPLLALKDKNLTHVKAGHHFSLAFCADAYRDNRRTKSEIEDLLAAPFHEAPTRNQKKETSHSRRSDSRTNT
jgi:hypothetical protein